MDITPQIIRTLTLENDECPFDNWYNSIRDAKARAVIAIRLARVRLGAFGDCGSSGENIQHLKIDFGPGYRIYFIQTERTIVILLGGGDKKSQDKDIKKAHKLWEENKNATERFQRDFFQGFSRPGIHTPLSG